MTIAPLDLRLAHFGLAVRGFSRPEVASFLNEAADAYEQTLRDTDRLRQEATAGSGIALGFGPGLMAETFAFRLAGC